MKYTNPIIPGFHADPSICRVGNDFYLVTSSFEYFPGVPIFHSKNLVNWTQIGHCLDRPSQLPLGNTDVSGGIFAPTIRHHDGIFYMVTTNITDGGHFYVTTEDPAGDWSDPIWIDAEGIDPDLFWDDDGRVYFSSDNGKGQVVLQREIELQTGKIISETKQVENFCGGKCPEAPHIYKIGDYYYLLIAEGGTEYGHCITIARGPSPLGPWETCPHNPILSHRSTGSPIQATGHADLIDDANGNWWMVCLGIRPKGYQPFHVLGRESFLAPVHWKDGWPIVGDCGMIALEMEGHSGLPEPESVELSTSDQFTREPLPFHWTYLGNPNPEQFTQTDSGIQLSCASENLDTILGQSWLGRRQQHFDFRAVCSLEFAPATSSEEAGLTIYQNKDHHYEIALTQRDGQKSLIVRRRIGSLVAEVARKTCASTNVSLVLQATTHQYQFGFVESSGDTTILASGEARYLSTEVGGKFTGVFLAMYATANGTESENCATFKGFDYHPA